MAQGLSLRLLQPVQAGPAPHTAPLLVPAGSLGPHTVHTLGPLLLRLHQGPGTPAGLLSDAGGHRRRGGSTGRESQPTDRPRAGQHAGRHPPLQLHLACEQRAPLIDSTQLHALQAGVQGATCLPSLSSTEGAWLSLGALDGCAKDSILWPYCLQGWLQSAHPSLCTLSASVSRYGPMACWLAHES